MSACGCDVDGPMATSADAAGAALLDSLKDALPIIRHTDLWLTERFVAEFVFELFRLEVTLFLRDPFLQTKVRLDSKQCHLCFSWPFKCCDRCFPFASCPACAKKCRLRRCGF